MIAVPASTVDASVEIQDRVRPTGFVGESRRPSTSEQLLTGAFFVAPFVALLALILMASRRTQLPIGTIIPVAASA